MCNWDLSVCYQMVKFEWHGSSTVKSDKGFLHAFSVFKFCRRRIDSNISVIPKGIIFGYLSNRMGKAVPIDFLQIDFYSQQVDVGPEGIEPSVSTGF